MTIWIYVLCCNWQLLEVPCSILCGEGEEWKEGRNEGRRLGGRDGQGKVCRQTIVTVSLSGLLFHSAFLPVSGLYKTREYILFIYVTPIPSPYHHLGKKIIWDQWRIPKTQWDNSERTSPSRCLDLTAASCSLPSLLPSTASPLEQRVSGYRPLCSLNQ